jgi:hypothetical protein
MFEIYRNSTLTTAATASSSSDGGSFSKTEENHMAHKIDGRTKKHESFTVFGRQQLPHRQFEASPLLTRGWVFQERLLSPRVLHFASQELMWECMEESWCECMEIDGTVHVKPVSKYWYSPKISHAAAFRRGPKLYVELQWRKIVGGHFLRRHYLTT